MNLGINILIAGLILCFYLINLKFTDNIKVILIFLILVSVISKIFPQILNLIISNIPMYIFYIKTRKILWSTILISISLIILILSNYLAIFCLEYIKKMNILINYESEGLLISIIVMIISFLISKFVGRFINVNIHIIKSKSNIKIILLMFVEVIITFFIFYLNSSLTSYNSIFNEINKVNGILFFTYFIIMIITIVLAFKLLNKESEIIRKEEKIYNIYEYTNNLESLYSDLRKFKHDYINIIASITGYIIEKDLKGLERHLYENIIPIENKIENSNHYITKLSNLKTLEIKGIIATKLLPIKNKGVDIIIDIFEPISIIDIDIIDLSRIIGIILDNAIEGVLESEEKYIKLAFIKKDNSVIIIVSNSCRENIEPIYKLYQEGFSTRGNNRGLGLSNLREILNKYNNIISDTIIKDNTFTQSIQIINNKLY